MMIVILGLVNTNVHKKIPKNVLVSSAYQRIYSQNNATRMGRQRITDICGYWSENAQQLHKDGWQIW